MELKLHPKYILIAGAHFNNVLTGTSEYGQRQFAISPFCHFVSLSALLPLALFILRKDEQHGSCHDKLVKVERLP